MHPLHKPSSCFSFQSSNKLKIDKTYVSGKSNLRPRPLKLVTMGSFHSRLVICLHYLS
ncbi:hypothetical protein HanRHA438_Chr14g0646171 [Helianthus annuus]|nr:hypothetical protein HanRHA438_Chr14g0646171 [Helianthus annuus]